jgi:hypothetical protein
VGADPTPYEWATWPMDKRVAEAKKLLADAGVKPGTKYSFSYNTSEYHKKMAVFVASEWKTKLGIIMETETMEFKVLAKKRHDGAFQIARNGWLADYNDATTFLALVRCDSVRRRSFQCASFRLSFRWTKSRRGMINHIEHGPVTGAFCLWKMGRKYVTRDSPDNLSYLDNTPCLR